MLDWMLAAAFQAAVTGDKAEAAMRCAPASIAVGAETPMLRTVSQFMHFVMEAASADGRGKPFLERMGELAEAAGKTAATPAVAATLIGDCDQRFPLARSMTRVTLPDDTFRRDVMCLGVLSLLEGAAQEQAKDSGNKTDVTRIAAALGPVHSRLTDEALTAKGYDDEAKFTVLMGDQIKASLVLGNPESVARACGLKDA